MKHGPYYRRDQYAAGTLAALRQAAGLTQADAAELMGVGERTWRRWEGDESTMRPVWRETFQRRLALLSARGAGVSNADGGD